MLLIVGLSVTAGDFPVHAMKQVDASLAAAGFRKEVASPVRPGKEYSVTYEGPDVKKDSIENLLRPLVEQHNLTLSIETEESVKFP